MGSKPVPVLEQGSKLVLVPVLGSMELEPVLVLGSMEPEQVLALGSKLVQVPELEQVLGSKPVPELEQVLGSKPVLELEQVLDSKPVLEPEQVQGSILVLELGKVLEPELGSKLWEPEVGKLVCKLASSCSA